MTTRRRTTLITLGLIIPAAAGLGGCTSPEASPGATPADHAHSSATATIDSITVFPVRAGGGTSCDFADALGLVLEKGGVPDVRTTDAVFAAPGEAWGPATLAAFRAFVQTQELETRHVLYAEYVGSPQHGVAEVRAVVVDAAGRLVWEDRQTPEDADFRRLKVRNPMTCCVLVRERLRPWLVNDPGASHRRMEELWEAKSGMPSAAERAAMRERQAAFRASDEPPAVQVFPVRIDMQEDGVAAKDLAARLRTHTKCVVTVAAASPDLEVAGSSNEQRVLWNLARSARDHVRRAGSSPAVYRLFAHYIIRPSDGKVFGVHFVLLDAAGEWVIVDYQNEYRRDFKRVLPTNVADCHNLVAQRLGGYLQ